MPGAAVDDPAELCSATRRTQSPSSLGEEVTRFFAAPDHRGGAMPEAVLVALGCTEFASDALAENADSAAAHHALGFEEVEVIRCFRKGLTSRTAI